MVTLPVSLYFVLTDSVIGGRSFGKKKMGIRVIEETGATLSMPKSIYRTILKFLPWEIAHYLVYRLVEVGDGEVHFNYYIIGGIIYALIFSYILTAIFTKKKQSFYISFPKTQVVKDS